MHSLLRPAAGRPGACLLESLPYEIDPVWNYPGASHQSRGTSGATAPGRRKQSVSLRGRRQDAGRTQLVLSARRQTGGVQIATGPEAALAQFGARLSVCAAGSHYGRVGRHLQLSEARRERACLEHRWGNTAVNGAPSSTWFTTGPHWGWYIALYFFFGGLAGGSYFLAALIDLFGRREDRPLAHIGYYVAFPCVALSGLLLTVDLGKPLRFWRMLIESNTYRPMFKYWSPMSIGSWVLLTFGFFTLASFLGALAEDGRIPWPAFRKLRAPAAPGLVVELLGGISGFYVASYTGVLLGVTNRPIWSDTPLLGMLFVVSAASTSAALITLLAHRSLGHSPALALPGLADLHRMETWVVALELLVFIAVVVSLGPVLSAWLNVWGLLLLIVVVLGLAPPLFLAWRRSPIRNVSMSATAILVLIAGLLLRVVIV